MIFEVVAEVYISGKFASKKSRSTSAFFPRNSAKHLGALAPATLHSFSDALQPRGQALLHRFQQRSREALRAFQGFGFGGYLLSSGIGFCQFACYTLEFDYPFLGLCYFIKKMLVWNVGHSHSHSSTVCVRFVKSKNTSESIVYRVYITGLFLGHQSGISTWLLCSPPAGCLPTRSEHYRMTLFLFPGFFRWEAVGSVSDLSTLSA